MLLGPVFQSDMVATARRGRYFALRVLFAAGLLLCLYFCYEGVTNWNNSSGKLSIREASSLASGFFQAFAWLTMLTAMVITPAVSAGAIATERERRTIEYLFATDLSNGEIILSKLASKLLLVGKLVLVALPVLSIFRLMGGIPGNLLVMYFVGLASTVTLLTVGAMCISVWSARARDAIIRVYLVEAVVFVLPFILLTLLTGMGAAGGATSWFADRLSEVVSICLEINPLQLMFNQMVRGGALGVGLDEAAIWRMVGIQLVLSAILAAVAVVAVRRVHLRAISSPGSADEKRRRWELPRFRPRLGSHPMLWKELFARAATTKLGVLGRVCVAVLLLVIVGVAFYMFLLVIDSNFNSWQSPGEQYAQVSMMMTGLLGVGTVVLMGLRAAGLIAYEKERDCWLSLLSTPLGGADIIGAKAIGNFYAYRWMFLPLAIVWALQLTLAPVYLLAIPLHLLAITATGLFATAVGLAFSLKFNSSLKAIGSTMVTLFFVGGGYLMCCCTPYLIAGGDDDIMKIALIGCVPFLQAVPSCFSLRRFLECSSDAAWITFDYMSSGVAVYAIAGMAILSSLVAHFDEMVGRSTSGFGSSLPRGSQQPPPLNPFDPPGPTGGEEASGAG